nr:immunoglobulin light chain junction region [Macaca mulatta]
DYYCSAWDSSLSTDVLF